MSEINIDIQGVSSLASRIGGEVFSSLEELAVRPFSISQLCQAPGLDFTSPAVVSRTQGLSNEMRSRILNISEQLDAISTSLNAVQSGFSEDDANATSALS